MRVWRGTRHVCFVSSYLFYFGRVVGGEGGGDGSCGSWIVIRLRFGIMASK